MDSAVALTTAGSTNRRTLSTNCKFLIAWLDKDIDIEAITGLRHLHDVQDILRVFSGADQCLDFVTDIKENENSVLLVVSVYMAESIVPIIHDLSQIDSIYIFDSNKKSNTGRQFTEWSKVKDVCADLVSTCAKLKRRVRDSLRKNDTSNEFTTLSLANTSSTDNNVTQHQEATFMYSRLLYLIFSEMEVSKDERDDFIYMCRTEDASNQKWINEFESNYDPQRAIWWYTRATGIYFTLNQAFYTLNVRVLMAMKFIIRDLYFHLHKLQSKASFPTTITVYRGQNMKHRDFERQLKNNAGGLLSVTTFWSTSRDMNVAHMFLERDPHKVAVIFEMNIDTTVDTDKSPFADIHNESAIEDEDEVLFSIGTVFRIVRVVHVENDDTWKVSLTMTTDADEKLYALTNQVIKEISGSTGYHRLGKLMCVMGKWNEAFEIYELLLDKTSNDDRPHLAHIHHQLGYICDKRAVLTQALNHYQQSVKYSSSDELQLASVYNSMGIIFYQRNDFNRALDHFNRSLEVELRSPSANQQNIAIRLNNIGGILKQQGKFKEALVNFEKVIDIQLKYLSPIHPHLAVTYNNIGTIHFALNNYSAALSYQQKTLEIQRLSLPPDHPSLAPVYCNIASTLEALDQYDRAIQHVRQAIDILLSTFEPDHPEVLGVQRGLEKLLREKKRKSKNSKKT